MRLSEIQKVHFVGIGGIGVSAIAQFLYDQGVEVTGSDLVEGKMTKKLLDRGIEVKIGHKATNVNETVDLVVYSLAITPDNPELLVAKDLGLQVLSYPDALGQLSENFLTIAVAGTHGKTTTTSMISKILIEAGLDPSVIVGSTVDFLDDQNYRVGKSDILVLEACEYHSAFLNLDPDILVITNVEHDHFDAYPTEESYLSAFKHLLDRVNPEYQIVVNTDFALGNKLAYFAAKKDLKVVTYGSEAEVDLSLLDKFKLNLRGLHNRVNALGAILAVSQLGVDDDYIQNSLSSFTPPARRFEDKGKINNMQLLSDYAHHPTEIKATLQAIREAYGDKKVLAVFQAHQHGRTKELLDEFSTAFADSDKVAILPIYAARDTEQDKAEMTAERFVSVLNKHHEHVELWHFENRDDYRKTLESESEDFDVAVIMGAGDVESYFFFS